MTTPAITTLTLKAAATSVGTGATMPTTANVSARGVEVVGAGILLAQYLLAASDILPVAVIILHKAGDVVFPLCNIVLFTSKYHLV